MPKSGPRSARARGGKRKPGKIRVGVSGWIYKPWRGTFYPKKLPQKRELAFLSEQFTTVEINGTFYGSQSPASFKRWAESVPEDFVFAVKGSRFITHILRLRNVQQALCNFCASGILRLGAKLGPVLWQFPPNFAFQKELFEAFLKLLPHNTAAAAKMAQRHDGRLKKGTWTKSDAKRPLLHAVEIRHDSFVDPAFIKMLRKYDVALVCADTVKWPRLMDATANDFIYCRLHGSEELYRSNYSAHDLGKWARRVVAWARGEKAQGKHVLKGKPDGRPRNVYLYFDNTDKVRAPGNAAGLIARVAKKMKC
jgi:uncharacterized protein YecE (DUF72 family)